MIDAAITKDECLKHLNSPERAMRVDALVKLCLYGMTYGDEVTIGATAESFEAMPDAKLVRAVINTFGFSSSALEKHKEAIMKELAGMQDVFFETPGGGMSMLQMVMDLNGEHWAEHRNAEALIALGIGIGMVSFPIPREIWRALPGSMPYIMIKDEVKSYRQ